MSETPHFGDLHPSMNWLPTVYAAPNPKMKILGASLCVLARLRLVSKQHRTIQPHRVLALNGLGNQAGALQMRVMSRIRLALVAGAFAFFGYQGKALSSPWSPATPRLPIEAAIGDYALTSVVMSPDGNHIAAVAPVRNGNPVIKVWDTRDLSKAPKVIGSARMRFFSVSFIKNDRLSIVVNQPVSAGANSDWFSKVLFSDLEGKEFIEPMKGAFELRQTAVASLVNRMARDPDHVLMASGSLFEAADIFKVNVRTGVGQRVARQGDNESLPSVGLDRDYNFRLKFDLKIENGIYYRRTFYRDLGGDWQMLEPLTVDFSSRKSVVVLRMSQDGKKLWVRTNKFSNFEAIYEFDVTTEKFSDNPIFANTEFDATSISFWSNNDEETLEGDPVAGFCFSGPVDECTYSDPTLQGIQTKLERQFPGKAVSLTSVKKGGQKALVEVTAANFPTTWYLFENGNKLTRIIGTLDGIDFDPAHHASAQWVTYKARDGLDIPGIVYLPPGYDAQRDGRIPLVVMPHGGPWWRDSMNWDAAAWAPLLATRGFAVLQPQYRGSEGIGLKLWLAGDNEWGAKMQDDKDDGARWLVETGVADPERMMMFGYSYGGFAAVAAAARSTSASKGLWQCAIAGAPAIDLERIKNDWGDSRFQRQIQGHTVGGWDPMENLDKVQIPLLVFHGSYDNQADVIHSRTATARIRQVNPNANYRYVEIPRMSHTLNQMTPEHREQFIPLMLDMLDHNCGNISKTFSEPGLKLPKNQKSAAVR